MKISFIICLFIFSSFFTFGQTDESVKINRLFYTVGISMAHNPSVGLRQAGKPSLGSSDFDNRTLIAGLDGTVNYHLIKKYFSVGAGTMLTRTYTPNYNQFWFYADLRGYLSDEINTIYIFLKIGKSIPIGNFLLNGQGVGLGAGFRFKVLGHIFLADVSLWSRSAQFDQERWISSNYKVGTGGTFFGLSYLF
jgi:hypothetical protein